MDSTATDDVTVDFTPYFRVLKSGVVDRFRPPQFAPPCADDNPEIPVRSKDIIISPETRLSVRLYIPKTTTIPAVQKLPLLVYIHGGAFCLGSASSPAFHNFVSKLVDKSKIVAVSVDYRLAPEHLLPIAYDDSWAAFQWVASHATGNGPDPWLNDHADFDRVFLGGESAGANIASDVAIRASVDQVPNDVAVFGMFLVDPYFVGKEEDKMYKFMCPTSSGGHDDPRLNPGCDPRLSGMGCKKVLVTVAERDGLKLRGVDYYEVLGKCGWRGVRDIAETEGEGHGFHLLNPGSEKVSVLLNRLACFLNQQ